MTPVTIEELAEAVRSAPRVLPVGGGTKSRLTQAEATKVSLRGLSGIIEYDPGEFTFTARAGTLLSEIEEALAASGQHLPFDPMLVAAGATIGGAVASGLNGPGRLRFGGIRDFVLGVRFVDGDGRLLSAGGKVVKNAAGFDLPKFFVGSLGRFGVLAEVTFKVFPAPETTTTIEFPVKAPAEAYELMRAVARSRFEPRALEYAPEAGIVLLRLGAPRAAIDVLTAAVLGQWPQGRLLNPEESQNIWYDLREFAWAHEGATLIKLALPPGSFEAVAGMPNCRVRISAAGDQAFLSMPPGTDAGPLDWPALTLRGSAPLFPGIRPAAPVLQRIKAVLDPKNRFPSLDD